jgi:hypothetical protein
VLYYTVAQLVSSLLFYLLSFLERKLTGDES